MKRNKSASEQMPTCISAGFRRQGKAGGQPAFF